MLGIYESLTSNYLASTCQQQQLLITISSFLGLFDHSRYHLGIVIVLIDLDSTLQNRPRLKI